MPTLGKFTGDVSSDSYVLGLYEHHTKPAFSLISKDIGYADFTSPMEQKMLIQCSTYLKTLKQ
jgi:hypothetical protein